MKEWVKKQGYEPTRNGRFPRSLRKRLWEEQDRECGICWKSIELDGESYVDHDHKSGRIRGVLCRSCNLALAYTNENEFTLRNMIEWIK